MSSTANGRPEGLDIERAVEVAVEAALAAGAKEADAWCEDAVNRTVRVYAGAVESVLEAGSRGVGVRVFLDGKRGYAYGSDLSERGLRIATGFEIGIRGDELSATLLTPEGDLAPAELRGRVVWAGSREIGIEVIEQSPSYRTLLAAAAGRWALVEELEHASDCPCAQGARGQRQP